MGCIYLIPFLAIYFLQKQMIFNPEPLPQNYVYSFPGNFKELFLETKDGAKLNALHFTVNNPKGAVLYFHGNGGELADWGKVVQKFVALQYDVLVMDYRTYGKSTGELSEKALYSDAQLFYDYLRKKYPDNKIVVYGRSLGTTFATYVAAKNNPEKLFLEAPFYSLDKVASSRFPIYPVSWFIKYHFPTYKFISEVKCPITIFHGTDDNVVNYENSQMLAKLVPKQNLTFITFPGGNHGNLIRFQKYKDTLESELGE